MFDCHNEIVYLIYTMYHNSLTTLTSPYFGKGAAKLWPNQHFTLQNYSNRITNGLWEANCTVVHISAIIRNCAALYNDHKANSHLNFDHPFIWEDNLSGDFALNLMCNWLWSHVLLPHNFARLTSAKNRCLSLARRVRIKGALVLVTMCIIRSLQNKINNGNLARDA